MECAVSLFPNRISYIVEEKKTPQSIEVFGIATDVNATHHRDRNVTYRPSRFNTEDTLSIWRIVRGYT